MPTDVQKLDDAMRGASALKARVDELDTNMGTRMDELNTRFDDVQKTIKESGFDRERTLSGVVARYGSLQGEDLLVRAFQDATPHAKAEQGRTLDKEERFILDWQRTCDQLLRVSGACGIPLSQYQQRDMLKKKCPSSYRAFELLKEDFKRLVETGTNIADWLPTLYSPRLLNLIRLESKVANLFQEIPMPRSPYRFPIEGADMSIEYALVSEQSSDTPTKWGATTPGTAAKLELDAKTLAGRTLFTMEADEESIIPTLDYIEFKHSVHHATCLEEILLNGDTTATHMDSDVTETTDARKAACGLRDIGLNGKTAATVDCSTFDDSAMGSLQKKGGKFAMSPGKWHWIPSVSAYLQMLLFNNVRTVDVYGPAATIVTGELMKYGGFSVVPSEYQRQNLNASGVYDGSVTTKTVVTGIHAPAYMIGRRKGITTRYSEELYMESGAKVFVSHQRVDFKEFRTAVADNTVVVGYNITT